MRKTAFALSLLFQLFVTFATLFVIYIVYALLDVDEADMINGIGFMIFQPLFGFILTGLTILICFIVGLPIRLKSKVRKWWLARPLLPIIGVTIGLCLLVIAFNFNLTEIKQIVLNGETVEKEVPNTAISVTGWFLTAFCLLHFYPQSVLSLFRRRREVSSSKLPVVGQKPSA
ncbi:hypothetical protein [Flavisolibacter ginsenosidimutans]|uniref:Uncharacterized protein n=1 Tax=Flavisolibacter ginsenosidimutans TaxID=661481 RepID=A0A5B8UEU9_9BACT|nr:hypothetical protein [Flavisolibacter ginsenosidimutans]QEC55201.1 hypothetical protein FSB75_04535 [Flavisolibacter ginsenosidimutans]